MKKLKTLSLFIFAVIIMAPVALFGMPPPEIASDHEAMLYPVVRVTTARAAGSGTVVYSRESENPGIFDTYVLTNHHVISDAIAITTEWNSSLGKDVKTERRSIVYVEIFQYRNISTPIGTLRVEADIVAYNKTEDMALLKLRSEVETKHVAKLAPKSSMLYVFTRTFAVGCSLAFPPLPTDGMVTRLNFMIESLPYHMSSAQIIYGNSGGAMFDGEHRLIGIPSRGAVVGWGVPVTHMGLFIPIDRVYKWADEAGYGFLFE
jgi:S1-C subfamily serine protease